MNISKEFNSFVKENEIDLREIVSSSVRNAELVLQKDELIESNVVFNFIVDVFVKTSDNIQDRIDNLVVLGHIPEFAKNNSTFEKVSKSFGEKHFDAMILALGSYNYLDDCESDDFDISDLKHIQNQVIEKHLNLVIRDFEKLLMRYYGLIKLIETQGVNV